MNFGGMLDYELLGNSVRLWATSVAAFLLVWLLLAIARRQAARRLKSFAARTNLTAVAIVDRVVGRTQWWFPLLVALFVSAPVLALSEQVVTVLERVLVVGLLFQFGFWITGALTAMLAERRRRQLREAPGEVAVTDLMWLLLRIAVWSLVVLLMLDNVGLNVTTLLAGLGIGGVAVALAAQSILSELFASLSIVMDRPFVVGDSLAVDDFTGTVERVGLKTTRLRSLSGEQLVFSNTDLLSSRIRNFGRMIRRRATFTIGVTYGTPAEDLRRIPEILRALIEAEKDASFERAHFMQYGEFALIFEVVYHVNTADFAAYADIQQRINLALYERFAEEGIEFALPVQRLYVAGHGGQLAEPQSERASPARHH